jgi:crotonobetainyl-CoA:carnitine CoA-transferase CaiB-like acyl-CoA transferase
VTTIASRRRHCAKKHINERLLLTQDALRTRPSDEWLERLTSEGVPCAPVLTRTEMLAHPQIHANEIVVETDHSIAGRLRQARPAARFSATPASIRAGAPALGEHTRAVLSELGYTPDEIDSLIKRQPNEADER